VIVDGERSECIRAIQDAYPRRAVQEFGEQGYCSYTLLVFPHELLPLRPEAHDAEFSPDERLVNNLSYEPLIVQIRPTQYAVDLRIAQVAKKLYPSLAPAVRSLNVELPGNLQAYEMERLQGVPLSRLLPRDRAVHTSLHRRQEKFIESFAAFIAQGCHLRSQAQSRSRNHRADSPMENSPKMLSQCTGRVGSSIIQRLEKLALDLPDAWLRQKARNVSAYIATVDDFPVVLNHGDLIPSNILVDENTWEMTGLVDWAEAEYLPFGTCLYGLELLLGYITPTSKSPFRPGNQSLIQDARPSFTYYENASWLRELFWTSLHDSVPDLEGRQEEILTIRDVGVLLWYGYAWDDGEINRVINEADDLEELACLRVFLNAS
jgi:hypothetical protein